MKHLKKGLGLLLALCMVLAMVPGFASAEEVSVSGNVYASDLPDGADVIITGNTTLSIDANKTISSISGDYELTLSGSSAYTLKVIAASGDAINVKRATISGNVTAETSSGYGIHITGEHNASLTDLTITSGTVNAAGEGGINVDSGMLEITGGTVTATAKGFNGAMSSNSTMTISGGTVTAEASWNQALSCYYGIEIGENAKVTVTTNSDYYPAISGGISSLILNGEVKASGGKYGAVAGKNISINGGNIFLAGSEAAVEAARNNPDGELSIDPSCMPLTYPVGGRVSDDKTTVVDSDGVTAKQVVVGEAPVFSISVTGGYAYNGSGTNLTQAAAGSWVYLKSYPVEGRYVTKWLSAQVGALEGPLGRFRMPAEDVTINPAYSAQTPYEIDLRSGEAEIDYDAFMALGDIYLPSVSGFSSDVKYAIDLDGKGSDDLYIIWFDSSDKYYAGACEGNSAGASFEVTEANIRAYSPITIVFDDLYNVTVTGGKAYDNNDNVITSAGEGERVWVWPDIVAGQYVSQWTSPELGTLGGPVEVFTMPARDVSLSPVYSAQTPYEIDLREGETEISTDAFWALMHIYCPDVGAIPQGWTRDIDLDGDAMPDMYLLCGTDGNDYAGPIPETNSIDISYDVTANHIWPWSPITVIFDDPYYSITITGGKVLDYWSGNELTEAQAGTFLEIWPTAVDTYKYVAQWDINGDLYEGPFAYFRMPENDVTITPVYADQTELELDIHTGGKLEIEHSAFWTIMTVYRPDVTSLSAGESINIDLDGNGTDDISLSLDGDSWYIQKLAGASPVGVFEITDPAVFEYRPVKLAFTIPPVLEATDPDEGTVGSPYEFHFIVEEGTGAFPITGEITAGELPPGLSFDGTTGTISGTPTKAIICYFSLKVTDAAGYTDEKEYRIRIRSAAPLDDEDEEEIYYFVVVEQPGGGTLSARPTSAKQGETVTITATPDAEFVLKELKAADSSGNSLRLRDNGDGTYAFTMPAARVRVSAVFEPEEINCPSEKFRDLDTSLWYHEAVDFVLENGLMNGVTENTFAPNGTMTRGMIVTILHRLEGEPGVSGPSPFDDVARGQWYTPAITWAAAYDIVLGYGDGSFGPNDFVTREQLAAIFCRYAAYKGYDVSKATEPGDGTERDIAFYRDADAITAYAVPAMKWAVGEGLVQGVLESLLSPAAGATRAQTAMILMRFCERYGR